MLIRNFGHLWERKYINRGTGGLGKRGDLKGFVTAKKAADFREQIGIYVLYDKDLVPIYIGQAGGGRNGLWNRLRQHEDDHLWNRWVYFSWFGFRRVNKNGTLNQFDDVEKIFRAKGSLLLNEVEGALITAMEPKLNKQGACWKEVDEYFQEVDDEMRELTVRNLADEFEELKKRLDLQAK